MAITVTGTNGITEDLSAGCYGDSARGIYLGELVQDLATAYGWDGPTVTAGGVLSPTCGDCDCTDPTAIGDLASDCECECHGANHGENYDDATTNAEDFLNAHTTGGYWTFDEGFYLIDSESVCERCSESFYGETLTLIDGDRYCERCAARNPDPVMIGDVATYPMGGDVSA